MLLDDCNDDDNGALETTAGTKNDALGGEDVMPFGKPSLPAS